MELKETYIKSKEDDPIIENSDYYRYIFKKTEKIACAVFYVMRSTHNIRQTDVVVLDLESAAQRLLHVSLESLTYTTHDVSLKALELKHVLVACEAKLRVANAAHLLNSDLLEVFVHEIDSVQRALRKYTEPTVSNPLAREESVEALALIRRPNRVKQVDARAVTQRQGEAPLLDRRTRILTTIKDKGEATIKDIVEVISDCSEKTIQRELISLINDNIIVREGERRWSKYKLI